MAGTKELLGFFEANKDVDVFCLQEIFNGGQEDNTDIIGDAERVEYDLLNLLDKTLPDHVGFFRPHIKDFSGLAVFIKKEFNVIEEGDCFVHKHEGYISKPLFGPQARNLQYLKLEIDGKKITVINFHGLWNGQGKTDTPDRINQSKKIVDFMKKIEGEIVLCGDFNLRPDTESLKMFEDFGLRNLIREYNVQSTRTSHYKKEERFADYAFVSSGVDVADFYVMPDEVSDHAALYLEIK